MKTTEKEAAMAKALELITLHKAIQYAAMARRAR